MFPSLLYETQMFDFLLPESAHNNTIAVDPRRCENVVWFENTKGTLPRVLGATFLFLLYFDIIHDVYSAVDSQK